MRNRSAAVGFFWVCLWCAGVLGVSSASAQLGPLNTFFVNKAVQINDQTVDCSVGPGVAVGTYSFSVPTAQGQQKATVFTSLGSQPSALQFCLQIYPQSNGCPSPQIKAGGMCYPNNWQNAPANGTLPYDFAPRVAENGTSWAVALTAWGPAGDYQVTGSLRVQFTPNFVMHPTPMVVMNRTPITRIATPVAALTHTLNRPSVPSPNLEAVGAIVVTAPAGGSTVAAGAHLPVRWTSSGTTADTVRIELVEAGGSQTVTVLKSAAPNNGSADCQVPLNLAGSYTVRVVTANNVQGESGAFSVSRLQRRR